MGEVLDRLDALTDAVGRLVAQGPRLVEWRPDHRRIADGGTHVHKQRKAAAGARR